MLCKIYTNFIHNLSKFFKNFQNFYKSFPTVPLFFFFFFIILTQYYFCNLPIMGGCTEMMDRKSQKLYFQNFAHQFVFETWGIEIRTLSLFNVGSCIRIFLTLFLSSYSLEAGIHLWTKPFVFSSHMVCKPNIHKCGQGLQTVHKWLADSSS